ncbi:MAG: PilZ domain-containing protein [Bdellovibrionales bacterium]|nr:PilZ domain-containing protein [Bdellovibrionales bacterium]
MQKLLIHCNGSIEIGEKIKHSMETQLPYEVRISFDQNRTRELLSQQKTNLLLYETDLLSSKDLNLVRDIREDGFDRSLLLLSAPLEDQKKLINDNLNVHYLEKPYDWKTLSGLTQKLIQKKSIPQQIHRRFTTRQSAQIETFTTGEAIEVEMFNLSMSGAYCEFNHNCKFDVGEMVRLRVDLDQINKTHNITARVVWFRRKNEANSNGAGMRFIKTNDFYRELKEIL